jgi:hypothetical protein
MAVNASWVCGMVWRGLAYLRIGDGCKCIMGLWYGMEGISISTDRSMENETEEMYMLLEPESLLLLQ